MIKSFAISAATAAFITATSAHAQSVETHQMEPLPANTITAQDTQSTAAPDACPQDKPVGDLTQEQRRACLENPQEDPFVVRLHGGVDEDSSKKIIENLLKFSQEDPNREIVFYINTPGGHTVQSMAIYDTMMAIPNDIRTICEGRAMSAGHLLLTAGTPGLREARPNCTIMGHQTNGGASGHIEDRRIRSEFSESLNNEHIGVIALHSGWDAETMRDILSHDVYMNAEEALEMNFIDRIIEPVKAVPSAGAKNENDIPAWLCEGARGDIVRACAGRDFD